MTERDGFPIVGVGASAGGIEALQGLFRGLPDEPGLALVVVTHLKPDQESVLHEILRRYTRLPVAVAADGMEVKKNRVYVMPADVSLGIGNRRLLVWKNNGQRERKPVDIFLGSLATDIGRLAGGIILSGADGDGTLGVKAIKNRGGITLAQIGDGFGPQHSGMPDTAISSGLIDFALPAEEMGARLAQFVRGSHSRDRVKPEVATSQEGPAIEKRLPEIFGILRSLVGHDFSHYETKTCARGVLRRMRATQLDTIEAYLERIRQEPKECGALFRDLLINVTNFSGDGAAAQFERELCETRERLQSTIEEYQTALEDLQSSNEEMQPMNEELAASKEELQSVNEELHTVNIELNGRLEELNRANSALQNLFESTDVATMFLDQRLTIRNFTPAVTKIFNILPTDTGRPIANFSTRLSLPTFVDDIQNVLAGGAPIERRVESDERTTDYLVRVAPHRGADHRIEGVVATFIDVTNLTRSEARQRLLVAELQHRTRNLLAIVQSLAQQTLGRGGSLDGFMTRIGALGRVQSLVAGAMDDEKINLRAIVELELHAVGAPDDKVTISGRPVALGSELVQTLALALHELATNAIKYGALRDGPGSLTIAWAIRSNGQGAPVLELLWKETGLAPYAKPSRRGFGRELIERALRVTLRAKTDLTFEEEGVSCRIELPLPADAGRPHVPAGWDGQTEPALVAAVATSGR